MESRSTQMQILFNGLTEKNQEIMILVARSIQVAQEAAKEPRKPRVRREAEHCLEES